MRVLKEDLIMGAIAGDYNFAEIKLLADANSSVVRRYVGKIIDRKENDPARHKGRIFLAYTTESNGWNIAKGFLCSGYRGWEDVECQPDGGGWTYLGVKTFFEKVVPISTLFNEGIRMYFDKKDNHLIFENGEEDETAFKELFRKMASEELE
jgi:hypothetical protein